MDENVDEECSNKRKTILFPLNACENFNPNFLDTFKMLEAFLKILGEIWMLE